MTARSFLGDLHDLARRTSIHPINPDDEEEYIINNNVALEMVEVPTRPDIIHFVSIRALDPAKGHGTGAMKKIFDLVDKNEVILVGKIMPYHTKDMPVKPLRDWYRKHGCRPVDPTREDDLWYRSKKSTDLNLDAQTLYKIRQGLSNEDYKEKLKFNKVVIFISIALIWIIIKQQVSH